MPNFTKRAGLLLGLGVLAVPLVGTALAYGCTAIATLSVSKGAAEPGSVVTVTGKGFGTHDPADARSSQPAEIRIGSLTGPVLATASPGGQERNFSVDVTVPEGVSGETFIAATQKNADGRTVYGTPARQAFTVSAPAPAPAPPPSPTVPAPALVPVIRDLVDDRAALDEAVSKCRSRYAARKRQTSRGKRTMAKKRSACVKRARSRLS